MRLRMIFAAFMAGLAALVGERSANADLMPNPNPTGNTITVSDAQTQSANFNNSGSVLVTNTGSVTTGYIVNFSNNTGGTVTNNGIWTQPNGLLLNYSNASFTNNAIFTGEIINNGGATVLNSGNLSSFFFYNDHSAGLSNSGTLSVQGNLDNSGTIVNTGTISGSSGYLDNSPGGVIFNYGTVTDVQFDAALGSSFLNNNNLTFPLYASVSNRGVLTNRGALTNNSDFTNAGSLINSGTLTNNEFMNNAVNAFLTNNGTILGQPLSNDGTLRGFGQTIGSITDAGTLSPSGNSLAAPGVYTVTGDYTKTGGPINIALGGLSNGGGVKSATQFDWVSVGGNLNFTGPATVHVSLLSGISPSDLQPGHHFAIMQFGGTLSGFGNLALDVSGAPLSQGHWTLTATASEVDLNIVPEPSAIALLACGGLGLLCWRRRQRRF